MENILWAIFWIGAEIVVTGLIFKTLTWADNTPIPPRKNKKK